MARTGTLFLGALAIGGAAGLLSLLERPLAKATGLPLPPEILPEAKQRIVLCFGDSLTTSKYWKNIKLPGDALINGKGWSGKMVEFILKNSKLVVAKAKPTDVVLLAGVNDVASSRSTARIIADLQAAWDYYHSQGARVIAVTLTPWFGYQKYFGAGKKTAQPFRDVTAAVNDYIRSRINQPGGPEVVVDTAELGDNRGALLKQYGGSSRDGGLHMNATGYAALATLIAKAL